MSEGAGEREREREKECKLDELLVICRACLFSRERARGENYAGQRQLREGLRAGCVMCSAGIFMVSVIFAGTGHFELKWLEWLSLQHF